MRRRSLAFQRPEWLLRRMCAGVLLALAACSTPPVVRLHTLLPNDPPATTDARPAPAGGTFPIVLEPVRMPAQVDQPQWLVRLPDGSMSSLEQERWASPLRDEIHQAVLEVLVRYGAIEARHVPAGAKPIRVGIEVRRFESLPGQEARIGGSWTMQGAEPTATPTHCEWLIRESAEGALANLAVAHRRAVARLGDVLGAALTAVRRGQPPLCPPKD